MRVEIYRQKTGKYHVVHSATRGGRQGGTQIGIRKTGKGREGDGGEERRVRLEKG